MSEEKSKITTIDEYIMQFPIEIQEMLQELRNVIRSETKDTNEKMSWQMPTFDLYGNLVHFAVHKNHIGFYPGESGILAFQDRFHEYKYSKGAVQFPLNQPLPLDLIREIVRYRVKENMQSFKEKQNKKKPLKDK